MAYKDGNKVTVGTGTWYTRLIVTADEGAASTDFTCELRLYANYEMYVDYNTASIKAGSSSGGSQYGSWTDGDHSLSYPSWSTEYVTIKTWTVTVAKGSAAKTVYFTGSYNLVAVLAGTSTASLAMTVPALVADAPTSCANVRVSDTRNDVSWTRGANADAAYASQHIERSIDGGAWSEIASVTASATSYADTTTSENHSYAYRVRAYSGAGYTDYATSETTYNTPAAPTGITAARSGETTVLLTIENPANTATALVLQRSEDGSTWATLYTIQDGKVTSVSDSPGGGTFYYRARNLRGELASAWSPASNAVVTITPPAAPTLLSPISGAVVDRALAGVSVSWAHNPVDGSAQTEAEIEYDWGEGAVTVSVEGDAQQRDIAETFPLNATVTIRVRTRGAHEDFGPWSASRTFYVKAAPTVYFSEPADGFVLETMPLSVAISYDDQSGTLAAATLTVLRDGTAVYTRDMGASTETEIRASDWLPDNGRSYTLRVEARSSSSLSASAIREISVDFLEPMRGTAEVSYDERTGYARLLLGIEQDESLAPASSLSVWRYVGSDGVLLASGMQAGAEVIDMYAPANVPYAYRVVSEAETGAIATVEVPALLETRWFYLYGKTVTARGTWNPSGQVKATRPSRRRVLYAGRELAVSYDAPNFADERSLSLLMRTKAEADAFFDLVRDGGRCVYKSGDGDVIHADAEVTLKPAYTAPTYYGTVSVTLHRIDGGEL